MKNIFLLLVLICAGLVSYAQKITYTGTVLSTDQQPLVGALIQSKASHQHTITDARGTFSITLPKDERQVIISNMGYLPKKVLLTSDTTNVIALHPSNELLEEVVISASREYQKRIEVPAAIATISAKDIQKTKAFGIEQWVNQVAGVYMSTSKAASNEQHFTATRSPISTKPLFLFLEDGLPLRPTAVFNHNALLELNTTAISKVEILKGPASSIYGSDAIGGSFNFITKQPASELSGSLGFQFNDLGLTRYEVEVSDQTSDSFGFYLGSHYVQRNNGPIEHSDYNKFAITFKTHYELNPRFRWTTVFDLIDYRSDMTGSLSEANYLAGNYESDQTFTNREALAFRLRNSFDYTWSDTHKTSFNFIYRNNRMDQNPSYRIRQFRTDGQLTGLGSGEVNSNQFDSFLGLIQHKMNFDFANSSLILGTSLDYSPQDYTALNTIVSVDSHTGKNIDFDILSDDYILNYKADIFNYAGYAQYEVSPLEKLKITAALRYDHFVYTYDNLIEGIAGARDDQTSYTNFAPKLGFNYQFNRHWGAYANYSNGFTPPQTSSLYRNRYVGVDQEIFELKPSRFDNFEVGSYYKTKRLKIDLAAYLLDGKNRFVTLRNENDSFYNANAGQTQSYGIEYGLSYHILPNLKITHNGSYAKHRYVDFQDRGIDYSDTTIPIAPNFIGNSLLQYDFKWRSLLGFVALEHEWIDAYNTSFENQISVTDSQGSTRTETATYKGHHIFNARIGFHYKTFEIWGHLLNIADELYAVRASYNRFRRANTYSIGNPRAFHMGIRYKF